MVYGIDKSLCLRCLFHVVNFIPFCNNKNDMEIDFKSKIPQYVMNVTQALKEAGYSCFLVGGSVRDIVMDIIPHDFDLTTDAVPEVIAKVFPRSVMTGAKFGTVVVLAEDREGEHHPVEVTTFRSEADYVDGRWPSKVEFTTELRQDLGRRDFTINAMAIDLQALDDDIAENDLVDPFGGRKDIIGGEIKAVGTPNERMLEDGLRGFRACRLASVLGFDIDSETMKAIKNNLNIAKQVSSERIRDEFVKLLMNSPKPSVGINLLRDAGLLEIFIPELLEGVGVAQPEQYHVHDVYDHILATVDAADDSVKLAALFHDIAKPRCEDDEGHFYHHDIESAKMTEEIMKRLKFSHSEIRVVKNLVRWHMFMYGNWRDGKFETNWTDAAVRRFIRNIGGEEYVDDLFKLRIADAISNPKAEFDPREIEALEMRVAKIRAQDMALSVADLDITGYDLMELGIENGPRVGEILEKLLDIVIEKPELNTKLELLNFAKKMI